MERKSFLLYKDYRDAVESMSDEDAGRLIKALFAHEDGDSVTLEGQLRATFILLSKQMDRDRANYAAMCARNRANGRKGGRPPAGGENPEQTGENPEQPAQTQSLPKAAYKDKDTDTDKETDEDKDVCTGTRGGWPRTHTPAAAPCFQKPSLDDVKAYCAERGNSVDAQRFIDFYESKGWMVGRSPMKDWKASLRLWEQEARAAPASSDDEYDDQYRFGR